MTDLIDTKAELTDARIEGNALAPAEGIGVHEGGEMTEVCVTPNLALCEEIDRLRARVAELEARLRIEQQKPRVRPGHHPPCPAMLDSEAECRCGQ